ncbi:MAG: hypothetical protein V1844_03990 [Pseudomonadota bacterium]
MDNTKLNEVMLKAIRKGKGIVNACPVSDADCRIIIDIEQDAENRSLMGLGKVVNTGVRAVLNCDAVYVALINMDFDQGCHPALIIKKGEEIVGEEIRDQDRIAQLSERKDVWFLHKNFVIYKTRISFPQDIMQKICYFETPGMPAAWCIPEDTTVCRTIIYSNPTTPSDVYLKKQYFDGLDELGLGTILIGIKYDSTHIAVKKPAESD